MTRSHYRREPLPPAAAIDRYVGGDDKAFSELYALVAPRLMRFFVRHTQDRGAAEDLTQQTLLNVHRARQSFARGSDVMPWVFAIARRLYVDFRRRRKNEVLFGWGEEEPVDHRSP